MENPSTHNVFESKTEEPSAEVKKEEPSRPRYTAWDHSSVAVCGDCGCLVLVTETTAHQDFHRSMMLHLPTRR